jgi:SAM-dependent methyltransferase
MLKFLRHRYYSRLADRLIKEYAYERLEFEDRDVLERIIFPNILAYNNPKKILDIGREDYQQFYNEFFKGKELWTIDRNPKRKEFGAENHITDNVANLKKHFKDNYFDFILMNGVFGWGLNKKEDIEKTFQAIYDILRPGGVFIFGYNAVPDLTPVPLTEIEALKKFNPFYFKPLKGSTFKANTGEHTYNFYQKK